MSITTHHPLYTECIGDWIQMRETGASERVVKEAGERYLPATANMHEDGMQAGKLGRACYDAYLMRARFPELVSEAVEAILGVMHNKPPEIELPDSMEFLKDKTTRRGESLEMLLRRVNEEQLLIGRCGLAVDIAEELTVPNASFRGRPVLAMYRAEDIINWDEGEPDGIGLHALNLVVLNESRSVREADFSWKMRTQYRVLQLGELGTLEPEGGAQYLSGVFSEKSYNSDEMEAPVFGSRSLDEIPFVFINAKDIVSDPHQPPLLGLSNLCLAIYRGEADYRRTLFTQGDDTLVIVGARKESATETADAPVRVGAGSRIELEIGGSAEYVGVRGEGLEEQRMALENDYNRASVKSGQLLDTVSRERESEGALTIRVSARTATINRVALAGAFGLQCALQKLARWMGLPPGQVDEIRVAPNLDFVDDQISGKELTDMMSAKTAGAPWSLKEIHRVMSERGLTEMTFEDELEQIQKEEEAMLMGAAGTTNPDGPTDDVPEAEPATGNDREGEDTQAGQREGRS